MYNIYAHYVNNKPVYIGKGKGKRHLDKRSYDDHISIVLYNNITEEKALELETWLINLIGLKNLRNKVIRGAWRLKNSGFKHVDKRFKSS